jgi:DNA-binding NarL/FixJ family response regulator
VRVIRAVTEGRVIIDPLVKEGLIGVSDARIALLNDLTHSEMALIRTGDAGAASLKELTRRELEVLSWMAKEMKNTSIAEVLCIDQRTVKCHINSIYNKLNGKLDSKHPRVSAIMLYLKAIGQLSGDETRRESPMPFSDRLKYSNLCLS